MARAALFGAVVAVPGCELGSESFLYLRSSGHAEHTTAPDAGRANRSPVLSLVFAAPMETDLGARITLSAAAEDPDGDRIAFHWIASGGVVARPQAARTYYVCKEPGEHAVVIVVTDAGGLEERMGFTVSCV